MSTAPDATLTELDRVQVLCDLERFIDAEQLINGVLLHEPENHRAWCLLAQCRLGRQEPEAAQDAARRAAALAPDHEWPHRLFSIAATALGQHDDAVRAAGEAVRLQPGLWQTHARLACAADRHPGAQVEAAAAADRALMLAPDQPQVHLIYGTVAAGQGRRDVAEQAYRTALALDPQNSTAHHLLATLQLHQRGGSAGLATAAAGFATALDADPTAQISRHSLEVTLRVFLGRATYFLFITAYLSVLFAARPATYARLIPVLLLLLPVIFVIGFVRRLELPLRNFLKQLLHRRATAAALQIQLVAVALVLAGSVAPQQTRPTLAAVAATLALTARLVLYTDTRRLLHSGD
jgi:tetratricopeptide (TPR) repeat protein